MLRNAPLIYRSASFARVVELTRRAARLGMNTLFRGPTGVAKLRLARLFHDASARRSGPFVVVSAAEMAESLVQRELFGHVKGAFSGAEADKPGLFQAARGGTAVLDDVDKSGGLAQSALLRFLDDRKIRPVGSTVCEAADANIVSTTNQDLVALAAAGRFLPDLLYRLAEMRIDIPPFRERPEDLPPLVEYLAREYAACEGRPAPRMDAAAMEILCAAPWPGNARDLARAVGECVMKADGGPITAELAREAAGLGAADPAAAELSRLAGLSLDERRSKEVLLKALELCRWNMTAVARALGLALRTVQRDCRGYGIRRRM